MVGRDDRLVGPRRDRTSTGPASSVFDPAPCRAHPPTPRTGPVARHVSPVRPRRAAPPASARRARARASDLTRASPPHRFVPPPIVFADLDPPPPRAPSSDVHAPSVAPLTRTPPPSERRRGPDGEVLAGVGDEAARRAQESRDELLSRVSNLKKDLQDWRFKLDNQVKSYRSELGDLRKTLDTEVTL